MGIFDKNISTDGTFGKVTVIFCNAPVRVIPSKTPSLLPLATQGTDNPLGAHPEDSDMVSVHIDHILALKIIEMYSGRQWCGTATAEWNSFKNHLKMVRIPQNSQVYFHGLK